MIARLGCVLVLAVAFTVADTGAAKAQCGVAGGLYGYGFGAYGFDVGRLYGVLSRNVPYYAAFPPVYYSAPVPRTYGYSPFAYPPGTATPEIDFGPVAAKEIINPFVPASTKQDTKAKANNVTQSGSTAVPLAIVNPYVDSSLAENAGPELRAAVLNR